MASAKTSPARAWAPNRRSHGRKTPGKSRDPHSKWTRSLVPASLEKSGWVRWIPIVLRCSYWGTWEAGNSIFWFWTFVFASSYIQQAHQSGSEDHEAWHHVSRSLHGRGQPDEDSAAWQTGPSQCCGHQGGAHLYHHWVHGERCVCVCVLVTILARPDLSDNIDNI